MSIWSCFETHIWLQGTTKWEEYLAMMKECKQTHASLSKDAWEAFCTLMNNELEEDLK